MRLYCLLLLASVSVPTSPLRADDPRIAGVNIMKLGMYWRVSVTLDHPDTGWDHYADAWQIVLEDGSVIGTRELMHPHVDERPFTRSLNAVVVPDGTQRFYIRARCSHDGWSKTLYPVDVGPVLN